MTPVEFGYNDPDADGRENRDQGWGCVYRSFQNVQSFLGAPVSPLGLLLRACGRVPPEWAEPAMFARPKVREVGGLLPPGWAVEPFLVGHSSQWLRHTQAVEYTRAAARDVFNVGPDVAPRTAFVVDDGVSAFAIVPYQGAWWWVDPHVGHGVRRSADVVRRLEAQPGWMVLRVTRPA